MNGPAKDSRGDAGPGWTPQTSPESCSTCHLSASRYIGGFRECDACHKYRKRHGKQRPQRLLAKAEEHRYERTARQLELDQLRANSFRNDILLDSHTDRNFVDYPDGVNRPVDRS